MVGPAPARPVVPRGVTLLEMMLALAVLSIGLLGLIPAITSSLHISRLNREQNMALNLARQKLAELEEFGTWDGTNGVFDYYRKAANRVFTNSDTRNLKDDAAPAGYVDGVFFQGRIFFPVNNPDSDNASLIENYKGGTLLADGTHSPTGQSFGLPASLNLNTNATETIGISGYEILPVVIRVSWTNSDVRARAVELRTVLSRY